MKNESKIELMAPAGDFESLQAGIDAGADSVYFGVEQLNMRARSTVNFTLNDLDQVAERCRKRGVRTYLTLNTVLYDHDIEAARRLIDKAKQTGLSAVIASDHAAILYAREIGMPVHISTQQNISNLEAVRFFSQYAETIVLARELSLRQVRHITDQIREQNILSPTGRPVEIEIFGHGALCMAVSGKCYLSLHTYNSSANRGACKQNCRKGYIVTEKETGEQLEIDNEYIMSPKDLSCLPFLDRVIDAGVKVLKIEGRGRSPEYVRTVIKTYREAIDACYRGEFTPQNVSRWEKELEKVYNRGFWSGYYLGQKLGEWSRIPGSNATHRKVYIGQCRHYYTKAGIGEFKIESAGMEIGERLIVTGPTTGVEEFTLETMMVEDKPAQKAVKGDIVTMKVNFKMRPSDKLFKLEANPDYRPEKR